MGYYTKSVPWAQKRADDRRQAAVSAAQDVGVVTHTTVLIGGITDIVLRANHAGTDQADIHATIGPFFLVFRNAAAVHGFISAFATVRANMMGLDGHAPPQRTAGSDFGSLTLAVAYYDAPDYAVIRGSRFNDRQRRTVHWVDLIMGPVTWRITDHTGYESMMDQFATLHRVSVGVFTDGGRFRKDPTKILDAFDD